MNRRINEFNREFDRVVYAIGDERSSKKLAQANRRHYAELEESIHVTVTVHNFETMTLPEVRGHINE